MVASPAYPVGPAARRAGARERGFKYALVAPSIFVLLLIGIFPLVYLLVVSFQNITMTDVDTSFQGLLNYRLLFHDRRLWEAMLHTLIFIVIALPVELVLGLLMAQLFIDRLPGRQVFIAPAGAAGGGFPDRCRRHLVADVRQPLRPDQPDHRLDRRRAGHAALDASNPTWSTPPS